MEIEHVVPIGNTLKTVYALCYIFIFTHLFSFSKGHLFAFFTFIKRPEAIYIFTTTIRDVLDRIFFFEGGRRTYFERRGELILTQ